MRSPGNPESPDQGLQQVLDRWKEAFGQQAALRAAAEPAVVRWEWAGSERYSLLPSYFQRYPGRGPLLKEPPSSASRYLRYGFDEHRRLRVHRVYDYLGLDGQERFQRDRARDFETDDVYEAYYAYRGTAAEIVEFSVPPRIPLGVQQIVYEGGRVVRHARFAVQGYHPVYHEKARDPDAFLEWLGSGRYHQFEEYLYDGDRLARIRLYSAEPGPPPYQAEDRFFYDQAGRLVRIEREYDDGARRILYRKREKGQTFASIRRDATQALVQAIVERLAAAQIGEELCCIELAYQWGMQHFPPLVQIGRQRDRQRRLDSGDPDALYHVFAPAGMAPGEWLEITDPDTLEICARLEQEIRMGEQWETAVAILRDVAARLTRHDWSGVLKTTPDFVVFAIDWEMEGDDLASVLAASASQAQIREWKARGWL